mmetsp:Transcript_29276/g.63517  ORF Transcript_29276/g.63517 Transcript_29276/m.63517 type:complete len:494 (+) Transcript_29276:126-1607(+)
MGSKDEADDDIDLAALKAFLSGGGPVADADAAVPDECFPPPPGFEHGPYGGSETKPKDVAASSAAASAPPHADGLVGEATGKVVACRAGEDLTSSYLAAESWEDLHLPEAILNGVREMNFVRPSKIQAWALPIAVTGGDIIGQAHNGSGKTAAFALAMLLRADSQWNYLSGLCVCPTRELAVQNYDVLKKLGQFTHFEMYLAVPQPERPPRKIGAHLVVGTPGKIQDFLRRKVLDAQWCKIMVIDEADTMIDESNQMGPQVTQIRSLLPDEIQVLLFSATWPTHVAEFANNLTRDATRIEVKKEDLTLVTINQTYIEVQEDSQKFQKLSDLYAALNVGQSIIFVNTRHKAFDLAKKMKAEGHTVSLICGTQKTGPEKIPEDERDRVMSEFRSGVTKVLIATDVLARGIDVPAVTLVVNYDLPESYYARGEVEMETYMHRIGRTGRFGLRGIAVNLVSAREGHKLDAIRTFYQCSIDQLSGDCEEMEDLLKSLR